MDNDFFRDSYLHAGWIPMWPFGHAIQVGALCQIHQGRMLPLLNMNDLNMLNPASMSDPVRLSMDEWRTTRDCLQLNSHIGIEEGQASQSCYREQNYSFVRQGSYLFYGREPHAHFLLNWHDMAEELIVKMTQSLYRFQDLYVITAVAQIPHWGLAIAAQEEARLRLVAEQDSNDCLFGSESCRLSDAQYLATLEYSTRQPLFFFQGKKLMLSAQKQGAYLQRLQTSDGLYSEENIRNWLQLNLLNLASSEELNINTCVEFFQWQDINLDDVTRLMEH